jgi:hypothetical protein
MDISDCFEILKVASFSVVGIVTWAIVCALVSLIISLTLMLIFRKKIMVKRAHTALKVLAIIWFVLVPLAAGYCGFKWGLADGAEDALVKNAHKLTGQLNTSFNKALQTACATFIESDEIKENINSSPDEMIDKLSGKIYDQYESVLKDKSADGDIKSKVSGFVLKLGSSEGVSYIIKKGIRKSLHKTLKVEENRTAEMMSKRLSDVQSANIFNDIVEGQIRHFFAGMKRSVIYLFLIILFFPSVEIGIAHWLHSRTKKSSLNNQEQ